MHRKVHLGQAPGFPGAFDAVDRQFLVGLTLMALHEVGRMHKHAARATGWIQDAPVIGLDDFHNQPDN
ncbi:hypothetical protein D3C73_629970 [compost metagenome]